MLPCVLPCSGSSLKFLLKRIWEMEPFRYHPEFSSPDIFYKRRNDKTPCKMRWLASRILEPHPTIIYDCLFSNASGPSTIPFIGLLISAELFVLGHPPHLQCLSHLVLTILPGIWDLYQAQSLGSISVLNTEQHLLYLCRVFLVPCRPCTVLVVKLSLVRFISRFFTCPEDPILLFLSFNILPLLQT